ncbi:MAG: lipid-A-disaccharide synthase [bacterium]
MTPAQSVGATLFVVVGEVSGDMQAARLVTELLRRDPSISVSGFGGSYMAAAGVRLLEDSTAWGVIGHVDPLRRLPAYVRALGRVESAIRECGPDVLLLVDFAAFNLRLAERLHGSVPVACYFPPMVSIRKGARARKVARLGMRLLATLRREAAAYEAAGGDVVFVGHPVVDLMERAVDPRGARRRLGIPENSPVIGLLPGSRHQEIHAHLPIMLDAAALIRHRLPDVRFVLPVPAKELGRPVEEYVKASPVPVRLTTESEEAIRSAVLLITATGTATLEATVLGVPMVAVYRLPWLSWVIARSVVTIRHAALPNILAGRGIVPELLQHRMTPTAIADAAVDLIRDPHRLRAMRDELLRVAADLGEPGAAGRAAGEVLRLLNLVASQKMRGVRWERA